MSLGASSPAARGRLRAAAAIVASALLLAAYAHLPWAWPLGAVVLVPWLWSLDALRGAGAASLSAVLMAIAFVAAAFAWFGSALGAYVGIGGWTGTALLLACAPLLQPQLLVFALVRWWVGRHHGAAVRALAAAAAWIGCEALWPKLLGDTLGHGLYPATWLRQVADLGGAAAITLLLLLVNEAIARGLAAWRRGSGARGARRPLAVAVVIVAAMAAYGGLRQAQLRAAPAATDAPLRVAMVQASITGYEQLRREIGAWATVRHILDTHYALSASAVRDHRADVLLWSETVYPTTFGRPRSADGAAFDAELQDFVDATGTALLFGAYDLDEAGEYNAAFLLEPGHGTVGRYRKTHPFPLTERVPRWLDGPLLRRLLPWAGGWQAGDGARVLPLRGGDGRSVEVVPLICLDDVRPQLAIDGTRLGAQAIVGMSNDSWFTAHPVGARLHLTVAAFRSIETGLPQLRVTTNGLSAVIDATGTVQARTRIGDQAVLTGELHARAPAPTLMVRWGDWSGRAAAWLLLAWLAFAAWRRSRARRVAAASPESPAMPDAALPPPPLRLSACLLRAVAGAGLAWLALDMLLRTGPQVNSLWQLQVFAGLVVLPMVLAWVLVRMHAATPRIDATTLLLSLRVGGGTGARIAAFARARAAARHRWLDHALLKFGAFPLLPALVAFRLHQVIAFGGSFGEWQTHGAAAWVSGLAIWWASWALGMMLFAAALRLVVEAIAVAVQVVAPRASAATRDLLEVLARAVYFIGVPAWLGWRLLLAG